MGEKGIIMMMMMMIMMMTMAMMIASADQRGIDVGAIHPGGAGRPSEDRREEDEYV
jgi:hypothetical protein